MTEQRWYEAFPPRGIGLAEVTAVVRVLAGRPRFGVLGLHPLVVFELWLHADRVRWLVGMDERLTSTLPGELRAQCPDLTLVALDEPERPALLTGRELRFRSVAYPVRTDTAEGVTAALLRIRSDLRKSEAVVVQWVVGPSHVRTDYPMPQTPLDWLGFTTPPEPDTTDQQAWRRKLQEPLFGIRGRTGAVAGDLRRAASLTRPVYTALALANDRHGRVQVSQQSSRIAAQAGQVMGRTRTWSGVVNAAELAVLVGWSIGDLELPGLTSALPPAPPQLLVPDDTNVTAERIAGSSVHPADHGHRVRLPLSGYRSHVQVVGPTGSGKSTTLARWAIAEAAANRSLVVIENRGDLVTDILARLPEHRHADVVVLDPGADGSWPVIGFNPLAGPRGDAERRADSLLGLFKELFGSAIGPRSSDVLLHALIAVSRLDDGALTDVMPFLTNSAFRRRVLVRVGDPLTLAPWAAWFDALSDVERAQVVSPVGNKLRIMTARPNLRRFLGQPHPKFDLGRVFERPTIVLVNLNVGAIGPESAKIIGTLLLHQLWIMIQRQTTKPARQRRIVPIVVDEWQTLVGSMDFADVLARARGAGAPFTLAHQHLDQLSPTLKAAALANARARFVFKPAEGDSKALAQVLGKPVTAEVLERLPAFHAIARVLVGGAPSTAFEVATPPLPKPSHDPYRLWRTSTERYGVNPGELDDSILRRWQGSDHAPDAPIGLRRKRS
jgi:hypothetical protein